MHKPEFVLENETQKFFFDFEIQMNHQLLVVKPNLVFINKKKRIYYLVDFTIPVDYRV